jgi:hypothetical protein
MERFLLALGVIFAVIGVKMIYDARPIVKEYFSFGDENEATLGMKLLGFITIILGGVLIYFNF